MVKLGKRGLHDCLFILWLFMRAGLLGGVGIYLLVWLLIPEQTMPGRMFFALIGFLLFVGVGVVQTVICYRTNKVSAAEKLNS